MTLESKLKPSMGSRLCHLNQVIEEDIDDLQERYRQGEVVWDDVEVKHNGAQSRAA